MANNSSPPYKILLPRTSLLIKDSTWQPRSAESAPSEGESTWRSAKILDGIWITTLENPQRGTRGPSDPDDQSMQELTFVDGSKIGEDRPPNVQRMVKSHARRWAYRDQRKKREERDRLDSSSSQQQSQSATHSSAPMSLHGSSTHLAELPSPPLTPYGALSFTVDINHHKFMEFYQHVVAPSVYPIEKRLTFNPATRDWFPMAMSDEASFSVACYGSSIIKTLLSNSKDFSEAEQLLQTALAKLLPRLDGTEGPTPATINAVATLCGMELILGNRQKWSLHRQGLIDLLRMKGGLSTLDYSLQLKACRVDAEGAVDWLTTPLLELPPLGCRLIPSDMGQPYMRSKQDNFLKLLTTAPMTPELRAAFCELWRLSAAFAETFQDPSGNTKVDPIDLEFDVMHIQHTLLKLPEAELFPLQRACQVGALLYLHSLLKTLPVPTLYTTFSVQELKRSIEMMDMNTAFSTPAPLMVWLYTMGALTSYGTSGYLPFMQALWMRVRAEGGAQSAWHKIETAVIRVLWIDELHGVHFKRYWDDFEASAQPDLYMEGDQT